MIQKTTYQPPSTTFCIHKDANSPQLTHLKILLAPISFPSQILLRIHDHALPPSKRVFKKRVMRRQRHSVVAALDDEVDLRQHCPHLRQPGGMVAEVVRARDGVQEWKDRTRYEWCDHGLFLLAMIAS